MDTTQLTQMVTWLDEELRRERAEVTKLQQLVERQLGELAEQSRQIKDLEGRLASTQAQLTKFSQLEQALQQLKTEVVLMLDSQSEEQLKAQRELEQRRLADREALSKGIAELRKELLRIARLEEALSVREAEDRRLGELLMTLRHEVTAMGKDFDERARNLTYLAEQRAYDNKRIAGLQEENLTLLKRTEEHGSKLTSLEDTAQRHERHIQELLQLTQELKRQQVQWLESQLLAEEQRKREMQEWRQEVSAQREDMKRLLARTEEFGKVAEAGRQALATLDTFKEQLRRDQNQVAELQRLAEERQRKELEEWQAENEKRWKKHELQWEHQWKEQYQRHNALLTRIAALEEEIEGLYPQLAGLWRLQEVYGAHRLAEVQRWQSELEKAVDERDKLARQRGK